MAAKPEYRDRDEVEVGVLDALVDRAEDGMTVLELRAAVDADIDRLETALGELKDDDLIRVEQGDSRVTIYPADEVVPDPGEAPENDQSLLDAIRDRIGL